jgi:hypothetical protein
MTDIKTCKYYNSVSKIPISKLPSSYNVKQQKIVKNKPLVTMGDLFGIRYYLKFYEIESTPAIERFINQTFDRGYNLKDFSSKENKTINKLIRLMLYSDPRPVENLIRFEKKKLETYENLVRHKKR